MGKGQLELKLRTDDTLRLLDGFQKVANRIAAGLVLAALIIGAAAGGILLLFNIFFHDTKRPPPPPR